MKRAVIVGLVALGIVHQDFWWWNRIEPLVFGFIPIGLAYQIGVSIAAGILWALAVHFCWPADVDVPDDPTGPSAAGASQARAR